MLTARQAQQERWDTYVDFEFEWYLSDSVLVDTLTTEACKYQLLLAPPSAQKALHSEKNMSDYIRGLKLDIFII